MSNPWITFIRQYSIDNNKSYSCSVSDSECSKLYKLSKIKKEPEAVIKKKPEEVIEYNDDKIDMEFQQSIYQNNIKVISNVLKKMNYKGKLNSNKVLMVMQLKQNFNINKMIEFLKLLKLEKI